MNMSKHMSGCNDGIGMVGITGATAQQVDHGSMTPRLAALEHTIDEIKKIISIITSNNEDKLTTDQQDQSHRLTTRQRRVHLVNQLTKSIEKWTPETSPEGWCTAFERALRDYDININDYAGCFRRCLPADISADLANNDHLNDDDYHGWKKVFLQEYGSQTRHPYPLAEMFNIKQQPGENALSTLRRIEIARRRIQGTYPERMYYEAYITAFGDQTTRHLRAANIKTFKALKDCIRTSLVDIHKDDSTDDANVWTDHTTIEH